MRKPEPPPLPLPSPAISGALDFFDPAPDPLHVAIAAPIDPAHQRRLQRIVTVALGVAAAIGVLALARVALDALG